MRCGGVEASFDVKSGSKLPHSKRPHYQKLGFIPCPMPNVQDSDHALAIPAIVDAVFADRKTAKALVKVRAGPPDFGKLGQEVELFSQAINNRCAASTLGRSAM